MRPSTARALLVGGCALWILAGLGRLALDSLWGFPRDFSDMDAVERWRFWSSALGMVSLAGTVAAMVGLTRLAFGGGVAAGVAAVGTAGMALVSATWLLLPVLGLESEGYEHAHAVLPWVQLAVWTLASVGMLATLWRFGARGPAFFVTAALIGAGLVAWLLGLLDLLSPEAEQALHPWFRAQSLGTHLGLGWLWLRAVMPAGERPAYAGGGVASPAAALALRHFRDLLIARVIVVVLGVALTFAVRGGSDPGAMKAVLYGGTLLGMALGFAMMLALWRFGGATPAGDGAARLAATMIGLSLLLDAWTISLLGDLFGGRLGAAFAALDTLPWVQGIGQILGLVGVLALVSALAAVGRLVEDDALVRRAGGLRVGLVALTVLAFAVRLLASGRRPSVGLLLPLAVIALVGAIALLVGVMRLVSTTATRLEGPAA